VRRQAGFLLPCAHQYNADRLLFDFESCSPAWVDRTTQALFLNRTGYNGLFRVNGVGNLCPFGRYKKPALGGSRQPARRRPLLQGVRWSTATSSRSGSSWMGAPSFIFDPPYRPLSRTASFTHYARQAFGDDQQLRLAAFYRLLDARGACLMLSNSDPQETEPGIILPARLCRVPVRAPAGQRNINSDPQRRGLVSELLILNY